MALINALASSFESFAGGSWLLIKRPPNGEPAVGLSDTVSLDKSGRVVRIAFLQKMSLTPALTVTRQGSWDREFALYQNRDTPRM